MKLKAGALYYALIFAILIAVVSGLLILFSFYNRTELNAYLNKQKLTRNVNSGFELLKSKDYPYQSTSLDLYGKGNDTVYIVKKHWGLFDVYAVKAQSRKDKVEKSALMGVQKSKYQNTALYLSNINKALSISGKTIIRGNAFLSKSGIKRASIEGKNYIGKELIYGKKFISEKQLPKLDLSKQNYISNILNGNFQEKYELKDLSELETFNNISNSFSKKAIIFKSNNRIYLNNIDLKGNIVIYSRQEIIVNKSSVLKNIVLVAPRVIIKNDVKSSMQILAQDSIIIEENVELEYPSSLALKSNSNGFIRIGENSKITGDVVLNGKNTIKKSSFINIEKDAVLEANVYCNGIVSLKGKIYGSLFCNKFYLKTPSAIYENYLLDAEIDVSKRNKYYSSGFIFEEQTDKRIVSWN